MGTSAWNNNNSESVNHMLKLAVDWKPQRVTDLVSHLRDTVALQYSDLKRALYGQGEFTLVPQYGCHTVPYTKWQMMSENKQAEAFAGFMGDNSVCCKTKTVQSTDTLLTVQGRGAGTDSGQGGQRFLKKNRRKAPKIFFTLPTLVFSLPTLDLIAWVGKNPPAIT